MSAYRILHAPDDVPMAVTDRSRLMVWTVFKGAYLQAASIECETLEDAFRLSNHIGETDWTTNPGVTRNNNLDLRSTSCGDVIVDPNGYHYLVQAQGYSLVVSA